MLLIFCNQRCLKRQTPSQKKWFLFLQKPNRIIQGAPKHVLHLIWNPSVISTAIMTALKVALLNVLLNGNFLQKWTIITGQNE